MIHWILLLEKYPLPTDPSCYILHLILRSIRGSDERFSRRLLSTINILHKHSSQARLLNPTMLHEGSTTPMLALISIFGLLCVAYSYALNRTNIAIHLKRKGYYRCPHYHHKDFLFGSEWPHALAAATSQGAGKDWYRKQFATYSKTFETNIWGTRIIQTCDSANIQALLTAPISDAGVGPSRSGLVAWLGPGTFTVDGEFWKNSRDLLKPVFKKTALSDMSRLERHLTRSLDQVEQEGLEVDLQAQFIRMVCQVPEEKPG